MSCIKSGKKKKKEKESSQSQIFFGVTAVCPMLGIVYIRQLYSYFVSSLCLFLLLKN